MRRLSYVLPLSAIVVLLFVSVAMAQDSPDQYTADPYGTDQTGMDQNAQVSEFNLVTVNIQPRGFNRAQLPVEPGTTVKWINLGTKPQTVTADDGSFDSGVLQRGQSFSFKFDELGTWTYHSETTPTMRGSVIVREAAPATEEAAPATEPTQPADDTAT